MPFIVACGSKVHFLVEIDRFCVTAYRPAICNTDSPMRALRLIVRRKGVKLKEGIVNTQDTFPLRSPRISELDEFFLEGLLPCVERHGPVLSMSVYFSGIVVSHGCFESNRWQGRFAIVPALHTGTIELPQTRMIMC